MIYCVQLQMSLPEYIQRYYIRVTSVKVHWIWAEAYRASACSTDKQTDRHTSDKQTDRQTSDKQTDRQTDRLIMLKKTTVKHNKNKISEKQKAVEYNGRILFYSSLKCVLKFNVCISALVKWYYLFTVMYSPD